VSACICRELLAERAALVDDSREETRLRRTFFGVEIQRWRLASVIVVPDDAMGGAPARASDARPGAVPVATAEADESTVENLAPVFPSGRLPHDRH
jgi:hypothetical protein